MTDSELCAAIVIPTLHPERAGALARAVQDTAGIPCAVVIVVDYDRRGGIIPANAGFRAALALGTPFVVYLNDDVELTQYGWLGRMIEALEMDTYYGIAAPSGPCRGGPQMTAGPGAERGVFVMPNPLAWFCAVLRREVLEQVGLFNPELIHYSGDSDLTRRAQAAGWLSVWVRDVYMGHHPVTPDGEWWEHDKAVYRRKWGK
jgi:GT2 family glycosyltransferase